MLQEFMLGGQMVRRLSAGFDPYSIVIAVVIFIVSTVLTILLTPKPKTTIPTAATIDEFQLPQHDEGTPVNVIFGRVWIDDPMVLWYGNLRNTSITKSSGGKK